MTVRVGVADDQPLIRTGLRTMIDHAPDLELAGEAEDGEQAVELARRHRPDVMLMDVRMPVLDGIEATRRITTGCRPGRRPRAGPHDLRPGRLGLRRDPRRGERGRSPRPQCHPPPHRGAGGTTRGGAARPAAAAPAHRPGAHVLALVGRGLSNTEIGERLYVSPATAKTHVSHVMTKLYARDRAQLVVIAYENGLVRPGE